MKSLFKRHYIKPALTLVFGLLMSGCASIEPWVQPYERENLADPIMSMNRNPVASSYTHHAFQAREGARGAEGGAGGGCGCN
ncbi:MAG: DUF4266 domain-containing protein [Paraglaciecola sp.]|uniref:DUF4266 domain-containing protein n=1 Tax=Paraglaciecola sp. TaxID=1920173 RepID=UPI00273ECCD4|nr:DUF4266 domain-containing protein [Paraglaciecola sp.]MDP5030587.1 DUF4266 domain-containing protein [Paraglaciecola sp.]MDP5129664.1 DUF4266 domain-containing protein [Paraglaciecola sp.]